ncbi:hypothetical protein A2841_01890 [Candidatus Kaiserbacteria bacterium RIFCSPHIGHO2_01_FULL_48_10]|uniref:Methyltransferase FkbM domain-containing protein n=1 Tax=Candidatus Kaiserbacteria bacterium RIFCSPHIGHO2_01_FULL_48_10 TaxID=1798476 RepID=A0A1F6C6E3_9BACT|nr:MAG: hypothetical protein A2841_01890 [Candidatus Kaiserbacteria bacterium RIFCSPHIGHO2_01_FULL_48_10]
MKIFNPKIDYLAKFLKYGVPKIKNGKFGIRYILYPESALDRHIRKYGIFQDFMTTRAKELLPQDSIIFDIGANVGLMTLPFAVLAAPKGKVYAFEPDFPVAARLQVNVDINYLQNAHVIPKVVQDNPNLKEITLYRRRAIDGDNLVNEGLSSTAKIPLHTILGYTVMCTTIDAFVKEQKIERVNLIKIDVEGTEIKVLRGGERCIDQNRPIIIYEYSAIIDELSRSDNSAKSFEFLKGRGYIQFEIFNERQLKKINEPDASIKSSNIIAFPQERINAYRLWINNVLGGYEKI